MGFGHCNGHLHPLYDGRRDVRIFVHIFDCVDRAVPMLLRMFEKHLRGYRALGYTTGDFAKKQVGPDFNRVLSGTSVRREW